MRVLSRDALDGPDTKVTLPSGGEGTARIGLVGDSLLTTWDVQRKDGDLRQRRGEPLKAVPLSGGAATTLLPHAQAEMAQVPGGGAGDLMTLSSSGYLTTHYGNGTGAFDTKASGSGWPAGTVAVPFGDLGEDRCNDLLVRMPGGELCRYTGKCAGGGYTPSSSYTVLGTGWDQYNVLTAPGDLTGDGRTDLLARHTDGTLFRYDGTAAGQFKSRVVVFTNWGSSYNALVGVGDITGDGKADLVARDTSGNVYRNSGDGKGSFSARTQIATGWQGYKGLF